MPNGGVNSRRDERERDPSCRASSIRGGVLVQRHRDDVPIRSVEVFVFSGANLGTVRKDDSSYDLGIFY